MTHICVGKLTIIGSDNGLSHERHQAIIWTNAGILLIGPLGTNFSEILIEIQTFSLKKIYTFKNVVCEMLFISSRPQCVILQPVNSTSAPQIWCLGSHCHGLMSTGYSTEEHGNWRIKPEKTSEKEYEVWSTGTPWSQNYTIFHWI